MHAFLVTFLAANGHSPSVREIARGLACSPSTVHRQLRDLEQLGLLRRSKGLARCLVLVVDAVACASAGEQLDELEIQAREFDLAADHAEAFVSAGIPVTPAIEHALRAACFRGYAQGVRWAAGRGQAP